METDENGGDRRLRVRVSSPGEVVIESAPLPELVDGEALIKLRLAGVCGSDVHASQGLHPFVPLPYYPGHEVVGELIAMRSESSRLSLGQTVVIEPTLVCGSCKQCESGNENLCERLEFFGCGYREGGMADVFAVPVDRLRSVDSDLDDVCAVLIEPLATPVHAARLAGDLLGRAVVILGAGTIGLLMLAVVRSLGVRAVVVTDKLERKRSRALKLGATAVVASDAIDLVEQVRVLLGESADVVFDCVAIQSTIDAAIAMVLKGGTVVVVGVPNAAVQIPLPIIQDQQVRLQGSATYTARDFAAATKLLRSGAVDAHEIVSAELPLEEAALAFELARSGEHTKVVLVGGSA